MKTLKDAIDLIMAQPPELHYPAYYADLLSEADVPDKDDGKCSEIPNSSDTISRQVAIDALSTPHGILYPIRTIEQLQSAQPEKRTDKHTETHACVLIDRQAAVDTLSVGKKALSRVLDEIDVVGTEREKYSWGLGLIEAAIKDIEELPPTELEPHWIPCSERLPKEKDAGILKKLGTDKRSEYVLATVEVKGERMVVTACTYDGVWHWDKKYAFPDFKVVAWMPMPEPWKGERHETD